MILEITNPRARRHSGSCTARGVVRWHVFGPGRWLDEGAFTVFFARAILYMSLDKYIVYFTCR